MVEQNPPQTCGCDESKSLYKSIQEIAEIGAQLNAEKRRLLEDLVDCERRLARMTVERDEAFEKLKERSNGRLLEDLADRERRLARMTVERDEAKEVISGLLKAAKPWSGSGS